MKKAQVTMFVIIGAVLLLAASLYFVITQNLQEGEQGEDLIDVSLETRPTFDVVEQCLSKISLDGLKKIAAQGGWLEFPGMTYSEYPYESDLVNFAPNKIAYWRHLYQCEEDKYCEESNMPPLCKPGSSKTCYSSQTGDNSIQEQLENYVDENLESCLNNFNSLKNQYQINVKGKPKSEFVFGLTGTRVILYYPLEIQSLKTQNTKLIEDYAVDFDIEFAEMYNLANEIVMFDKQVDFYQSQTMNLISIYGGVDEPLPPTDAIQFFSPDQKIWVQQEVKDILQYDLLPFMGTIRFMNSKNYYPVVENADLEEYTKYSQGIYMGMNPKIGQDNKQYNYNIINHYTYLPIYSKVGNGKTLIKPTSLGDDSNIVLKMAGLFLKDYRFKYDIRYPLVVTINDDESMNGDGFDFNFAVEVNIRNNVDAYNNFTSLDAPAPFQTNLANFQLRLPQNITLRTYNKYTNEPIEEVKVSYICGREYEIGETSMNSREATFTTTLPYCEMGGYLKFTKEGFAGTTLAYDNKIDGPNQEFSAQLWPLQEKEIIVMKRTVEDIQTIKTAGGDAILVYGSAIHNLSDNETVLLNVVNVKENPYDEDVPSIGFLKYQQPGTSVQVNKIIPANENVLTKQSIENAFQQGTIDSATKEELLAELNEASQETYLNIKEQSKEKYTLSLAPGQYEIDASLFNYNGIQIPMDTMQICPDDIISNLFCDEDPVTLPAQNFSIWMSGGIKQNITLTPVNLYSDKKIILYILEMDIPNSWDELTNVQTIEQYQLDKLNYVIPRFEE